MTKLSRKPTSDEKLGQLINNLWSAFVLMNSKQEIRVFFKDLFTHTEYKMLAKRFAIARLLLDGENYDVIRNSLNVTPGTISHVSNVLAIRGEGYKIAYLRLNDIAKSRQRKIAERQDYIEHRKRRKLPGETFLTDAAVAGIKAIDKTISRRFKRNSARENLTL